MLVYTCFPGRREWKHFYQSLASPNGGMSTRAFPVGGNGNHKGRTGLPAGIPLSLHVLSRSEGMETLLRTVARCFSLSVYTCFPGRREWKLFFTRLKYTFKVSLHVLSRSEEIETYTVDRWVLG